ncbi:neuromedin-S [Scleropages formosus]|uniref:neuromedin-S n=1 Tax=Scleropages formosus TaxID=113540 RepID=UPI0008783E42|nr:neuromedin-S [Scleropages formosus]
MDAMDRTRPGHLSLVLLFYCLTCGSPASTGLPSGLSGCLEDLPLRELSEVRQKMCEMVWRDHNKDETQDVYKRFLFHYSKAQNSLRSMKSESQSVHPLMRLSPKLSQKRKKPVPWRS